MQPRPGGYSCPANPNQVTLEVEREGYVFELYLPASHSMGPPQSGTISHQPSSLFTFPIPPLHRSDPQPFQSPTNGNLSHAPAHLPDEPQVFLAVFPASHLEMREHLDDSSPGSKSGLAQIRPASSAHLQSIQRQQNSPHLIRLLIKQSGSYQMTNPITSLPPLPLSTLPSHENPDGRSSQGQTPTLGSNSKHQGSCQTTTRSRYDAISSTGLSMVTIPSISTSLFATPTLAPSSIAKILTSPIVGIHPIENTIVP
ncbi:hypothetical protein PCANC_22671 [Puccinia coronata f. sp. avenae]|uniref:Uncharacterized protein n=1 Tax=Puccinia coronata f. sp. avenae TaxID=200324 RepID=A0A2N5TVL6_9BASI|nr:hypothetical protein PCANC_22671 [Puccinia coronata f. sp. avenae]